MKLTHLLLAVLLGVAATLGTLYTTGRLNANTNAAQPVKESAYDRIMRTGTIRCGYFLFPKMIDRNPNTGEMTGIMVDLMNEVGKRLSLKIEWNYEVSLATAFDGLKIGQYDVMCMPFGQTPGRARETEFTVPFIIFPYFLYARADNVRFDNAYDKINDPSVKVAVLEGEMSQTVKSEDFPKAQTLSMPDITDISQVLLQVAMGKADVAMTEPSSAEGFLKGNPGKLKRVQGPSVRMQPGGLDVGLGEEKLKSMLNTTLLSLLTTGYIERMLDKYTTAPDQFFLPTDVWSKSTKPQAKTKP